MGITRRTTYKFTPREVQIYKKERALAESKRVDVTNAILIASRNRNLAQFRTNPKMEKTLDRLNDTVKSKPIENTIKVINYWLEASKFTDVSE